MLVMSVEGDQAECLWMDGEKNRSGRFLLESLKLLEPEDCAGPGMGRAAR